MRVGFVTQLLWDRYGPLWLHLVRDAGAEPLLPTVEAVRSALADDRVSGIGPLSFRLAAAQTLALADADALIVPDLNSAGEGVATASSPLARGGAADPWIADFPDALRTAVAGIPPLLQVPASLEAGVERAAVTALQNLLHDAHSVRRIWGRRRAEARPPKPPAPRWTLVPGESRIVGLVAQPWLLNDALARRASGRGEHVVSQHRLDPRRLREEAQRWGERLLPTDAEVLGAARLFARRGGVSEVRFLADRASGADAWLLGRMRSLLRKPVEVRYLQDVLAGVDPVDVLLVTPED